MNLIEKFHKKVGHLVKGDIWNRDYSDDNIHFPKEIKGRKVLTFEEKEIERDRLLKIVLK